MVKRLRSVTCYTIGLSHTKQHYNTNNTAKDWDMIPMNQLTLNSFDYKKISLSNALEKLSRSNMDGQRRHSVSRRAYLLQTLKKTCTLTIYVPTIGWQATVFMRTQRVLS